MQTILVVDNDREAREFLRTLFFRNDYEVLVADTLAAAKSVIHDAGVHLVVCDVVLPDGNAFEFRKRLSDPPPFLFMSGYSESFIDYVPSEHTSFVMKPINVPYLLVKTKDMIESNIR